jgi:YD repeat-containing protein
MAKVSYRASQTKQRPTLTLNLFTTLLLALLPHASHGALEGGDQRPKTAEFVIPVEVDEIDPNRGNLVIRNKDLVLPGNGGLDIEVWRIYDMSSASSGLMASHSQSYRWTALGPGWTLGIAPRIYNRNSYHQGPDEVAGSSVVIYQELWISSLCKGEIMGRSYLPGATSLQLPDGRNQELISFAPYKAVTASNWKVECLSNRISATSPNGINYDFGDYADRSIGVFATSLADNHIVSTSPSGIPSLVKLPSWTDSYFVAKSATDLSGNTLAYQYQQFGTVIPPWEPGRSSGPLIATVDEISKIESPSLLLTGVTSSDGRNLTLTYNQESGRLSSITDNLGRRWEYSHMARDANNSNELAKVTLPTGQEWLYSYAPGPYYNRNIEGVGQSDATITSRKLVSMTYPSGGAVSYEYGFYNLKGWISSGSSGTASRVAGERVTKRTRSTGESWTYQYLRGDTGAYDETKISGPEGVTLYKYMGPGFAMRTTGGVAPSYIDNAWQIGSLISKTDPMGNVETYVWQRREINAHPFTALDLGYIDDQKTWIPDLQSRTITQDGATYQISYTNYDAYGNPGTKVENGPNGGSRTTELTYLNDPEKWIIGLLKDETETGGTTNRTFDINGKLLSITRDGVAISYAYDSQGNIASKTMPGGMTYRYLDYKRGIPQTELQPEGITITRVVDDAGNVVTETDGEGKVRSYTFDGMGRMTSMTPPLGNSKTITYTATGKTAISGELAEITLYEPFGQPASITLGGVTRTYRYDGTGRLIFVSNPDGTTGTSYHYDAPGRVTRITNADDSFQSITFGPGTRSVTDERNQITSYTYRSYGDPSEQYLIAVAAPEASASLTIERNPRNKVTSVSQAGITRGYGYDSNHYLVSTTNPETGLTQYGRDAAGNLTTKTVAGSTVATYNYDGLNRVTSVIYSEGTPSVTNTYDKNNRLLTSASLGGNRNFNYDDAGNLIQETLDINDTSLSMAYDYNGNGQLSAITYPHSGRIVSYTPDALGRPTQVSGYVNNIAYWPSGQVQRIIYANGAISEYGQNNRLWPSGFRTGTPSGQHIDSSYAYDGVGNLIEITDAVDATYNRTLGFDGINRLIGASGYWGAGEIFYDGAGNIIKQSWGDSSLLYMYDSMNLLRSVSGLKESSFDYDLQGNIVSESGLIYSYDDVPNLVCINCTNSQVQTKYTYDGLNLRSSVHKSGTNIKYEMYDSTGKLMVEYTPDEEHKLTEYIYLGEKRIAQHTSP